ncbi:MAG: hypothetical protein PQJ50_18440 [Spirochaetales bacterium]|nr:hypothetical protein [Spirochaetales bacterium]
MKKTVFLILMILVMTGSVWAQSLYFDIGIGVGMATTKLNDVDIMDGSTGVNELGIDLSLKLGWGPIMGIPIYVVGEIGGIGHRIYDDYNYLQFNSYLLGPGIVFYPVSFLQVAGSFGWSFLANDTDYTGVYLYDSKSGYAWNISAALDLGGGNHGLLIGGKYTMAVNTIEISEAEQKQSLISIFIKYAYRQKKSSSRSSVDW